jgi:hypothetical protein
VTNIGDTVSDSVTELGETVTETVEGTNSSPSEANAPTLLIAGEDPKAPKEGLPGLLEKTREYLSETWNKITDTILIENNAVNKKMTFLFKEEGGAQTEDAKPAKKDKKEKKDVEAAAEGEEGGEDAKPAKKDKKDAKADDAKDPKDPTGNMYGSGCDHQDWNCLDQFGTANPELLPCADDDNDCWEKVLTD